MVAVAMMLSGRGPNATAGTGSSVCGSLPPGTTVWNALGSPYQLCDGGVSIPADATLRIDGALGPVQVHATGFGGLQVAGVLTTANTNAASTVTFDGPSTTPGSWLGISELSASQPGTASVSLAYVVIRNPIVGVGGS